jgi:hypothetical protein
MASFTNLAFAKFHTLTVSDIAFIEVASQDDDMDTKKAISALQRATDQWITSTSEGQEAFMASEGQLNITQLRYHLDEDSALHASLTEQGISIDTTEFDTTSCCVTEELIDIDTVLTTIPFHS